MTSCGNETWRPVTQSHGAGRAERRRTAGIEATDGATGKNDQGTLGFRRPSEARTRAYSRMMNGVLPTGVLKRYV
jgi:hypothetical protein